MRRFYQSFYRQYIYLIVCSDKKTYSVAGEQKKKICSLNRYLPIASYVSACFGREGKRRSSA